MKQHIYYIAENTSDQDVKLDIVLENGELAEDVFRAHEVVSGLTYNAMMMLIYLDHYGVIKTQRVVEEVTKPAWMSEGF